MVTSDSDEVDHDTRSREIAIVQYPDCQLAAVYGLTDVFRIATEQMALAGRSNEHIRVSHWVWSEEAVTCSYDSHPGTPHKPSHVLFPPSLIPPERMSTVRTLRDWALEQRYNGATLCALCAGVFVLAETGVLERRHATTHWAFVDEFKKRFPGVLLDAEQMVIDEGDVVTAAGIMAWLDLGLSIVESMLGPSIMLRTAKFMIADAPRSQQLPYIELLPSTEHHDEVVRLAQQTLDLELASAPSLAHLANVTATHPRTLQRRFLQATGLSITQYVQHLRIERATYALATTQDSFEKIAHSVGYDDPTTLRRLIRRETGISPAEHRRKFGTASAGSSK